MDQCRRTRITTAVVNRLSLLAVLCVAGAALLWWAPAKAQEVPPLPQQPALTPDTACKMCHADTDAHYTFPSGEVLTATVDLPALAASVHGTEAAQPVYCTDCHQDRQRYKYPHEENPAKTAEDFREEVATNCEQCHAPASEHNPGHLQYLENQDVPNCVDCHGGHTVVPADAMAADPIGTCQSCHATYEDPGVQSVHTEIVANLGADQTCETCHGGEEQPVDTKCQTCHSLLTRQLTLESGETVDLSVHASDIYSSVHGARTVDGQEYEALQCTDCHKSQAFNGFPHPIVDSATRRELTIDMENVCTSCHEDIAERNHDGVHAVAIAEGELNAATCADCHGNHSIQDPDQPRGHVSETCGKCHSTINEQYASSVHGAALLGEDNPDVPICTDCHGVHDIGDPTTVAFRLKSPQMCGDCHADSAMMQKYGISTDVFDTYVADFHGTTVELFEKQHPDQETNKAVCYDCHGVHNILPTTDEHSQVIKQNLLTTCQKCHPDATDNFPDSWTSHFKPSLENNTLVYLVDLFYAILIPFTVGAMVLFIGTDVFRRVWNRIRGRKQNHP